MKRVGITRDELAERIQAYYRKKANGEKPTKAEERVIAHHETCKECRCKR